MPHNRWHTLAGWDALRLQLVLWEDHTDVGDLTKVKLWASHWFDITWRAE
jgi:hypothetical protein